MHRLRAALGDDGPRIETVGAGYRLRLSVDELDAPHFEWLVDAAATAADGGDAVGVLGHIGRAERLWLGTPLEEFEHEPWATPAVVRLRERRANLRERRAAALIAVGRPTQAIEVLDPLVLDEPSALERIVPPLPTLTACVAGRDAAPWRLTRTRRRTDTGRLAALLWRWRAPRDSRAAESPRGAPVSSSDATIVDA